MPDTRQPEDFVFIVNKQPCIRIDTSAKKMKVLSMYNNNFFTELVELKGKVKLDYKNAPGYIFKANSKLALKNAWLKG